MKKRQTIGTLGPLIAQGREAEVYGWGKNQVLKLFRKGRDPSSVEREAEVIGAVHRSGLPVPDVGGVVQSGERHGIVFERFAGPSMLQEVISKPWMLVGRARLLAELHAAIHECSVPGLPSQREFVATRVRAGGKGLPERARAAAERALDELPDDTVLCHGDFHPDNILMSSRGPIIIDWSYASHGNPLADVVSTSLLIRTADLPPGMTARWPRLLDVGRNVFNYFYLKRYSRLRPVSRQEETAWQLPAAVASLMEETSDKEEARLLGIIECSL